MGNVTMSIGKHCKDALSKLTLWAVVLGVALIALGLIIKPSHASDSTWSPQVPFVENSGCDQVADFERKSWFVFGFRPLLAETYSTPESITDLLSNLGVDVDNMVAPPEEAVVYIYTTMMPDKGLLVVSNDSNCLLKFKLVPWSSLDGSNLGVGA